MKVGDVVKHRYNGKILNFLVLGPYDCIRAGDVQCLVNFEQPMFYSQTLDQYHKGLVFKASEAAGETIENGGHTGRIYLRPIEGQDDFTERMKRCLSPQGTAPVVRLFLDSATYFKKDFVDECVDEIRKIDLRVRMGDTPTPLELLAIHVLCDSSGVKIEGVKK